MKIIGDDGQHCDREPTTLLQVSSISLWPTVMDYRQHGIVTAHIT